MSKLPLFQVSSKTEKAKFEERTQKHFEAFWKSFTPRENAREHARIQRTLSILEKEKGTKLADLGCGRAPFLSYLSKKGYQVTAVDVAANALQIANSHFVRGCLPYLKLADESFEGILLTDVIAEIEPQLHRLTLSESARLLKREGWAIFSTPIDIYSEDALSRFLQLIETEFEIVEKKVSYHRIYLFLESLLKAPLRFVKANEKTYRLKQLEKRRGFYRLWFYLNTTPLLIHFWKPLATLIEPIKNFTLRSSRLLLFCEKFSKILLYDSAATHVIVRARKKRLF